jgi:hypothetical protein
MPDVTRETLPTPESRRPLVPVEVPALGGTLCVRRLSAAEAFALPDDERRFIGELLVRSTHFPDGSRIWADDAIETVLAYPAADLQPLIDQALAINGIAAIVTPTAPPPAPAPAGKE